MSQNNSTKNLKDAGISTLELENEAKDEHQSLAQIHFQQLLKNKFIDNRHKSLVARNVAFQSSNNENMVYSLQGFQASIVGLLGKQTQWTNPFTYQRAYFDFGDGSDFQDVLGKEIKILEQSIEERVNSFQNAQISLLGVCEFNEKKYDEKLYLHKDALLQKDYNQYSLFQPNNVNQGKSQSLLNSNAQLQQNQQKDKSNIQYESITAFTFNLRNIAKFCQDQINVESANENNENVQILFQMCTSSKMAYSQSMNQFMKVAQNPLQVLGPSEFAKKMLVQTRILFYSQIEDTSDQKIGRNITLFNSQNKPIQKNRMIIQQMEQNHQTLMVKMRNEITGNENLDDIFYRIVQSNLKDMNAQEQIQEFIRQMDISETFKVKDQRETDDMEQMNLTKRIQQQDSYDDQTVLKEEQKKKIFNLKSKKLKKLLNLQNAYNCQINQKQAINVQSKLMSNKSNKLIENVQDQDENNYKTFYDNIQENQKIDSQKNETIKSIIDNQITSHSPKINLKKIPNIKKQNIIENIDKKNNSELQFKSLEPPLQSSLIIKPLIRNKIIRKTDNYQSQYVISDETRQTKNNYIYEDTEINKYSQKIIKENKEIKAQLKIQDNSIQENEKSMERQSIILNDTSILTDLNDQKKLQNQRYNSQMRLSSLKSDFQYLSNNILFNHIINFPSLKISSNQEKSLSKKNDSLIVDQELKRTQSQIKNSQNKIVNYKKGNMTALQEKSDRFAQKVNHKQKSQLEIIQPPKIPDNNKSGIKRSSVDLHQPTDTLQKNEKKSKFVTKRFSIEKRSSQGGEIPNEQSKVSHNITNFNTINNIHINTSNHNIKNKFNYEQKQNLIWNHQDDSITFEKEGGMNSYSTLGVFKNCLKNSQINFPIVDIYKFRKNLNKQLLQTSRIAEDINSRNLKFQQMKYSSLRVAQT